MNETYLPADNRVRCSQVKVQCAAMLTCDNRVRSERAFESGRAFQSEGSWSARGIHLDCVAVKEFVGSGGAPDPWALHLF